MFNFPDHIVDTLNLSASELDSIIAQARQMKVADAPGLLQGKTVITAFFEPSTRTRVSFEIAAKRLGAHVVDLDAGRSSTQKGESFLDTILTLDAMSPEYIVIRHGESGILSLLQGKIRASIINAGDGWREHPTQALGDLLTILDAKGRIQGLKVAMCGDVVRGRAARSNINILRTLGAEISLVTSPVALINPEHFPGCAIHYDMPEGVRDADVVMYYRYKKEYDSAISEAPHYAHCKLTKSALATSKPDVCIMHPGPVIRDEDMEFDLADSAQSLILNQVSNCLYVRQALLTLLRGRSI